MKAYTYFIKTRLNFVGLMSTIGGLLFLGITDVFAYTLLIIGGLISIFVCSTLLIEESTK